MSIKQKSFEIADMFLLKILRFFSLSNLSSTINIFAYNEQDNSVGVNIDNTIKLYAIKLESPSNVVKRATMFDAFANQVKYDSENTEILLSFVKYGDRQAIYIFTFSKKIIQQLAKDFDTKLLPPQNIVCALFDIFLANHYEFKNNAFYDKNNASTTMGFQIDALGKKFSSMVAAASDNILKNYTPYQVTSFVDSLDYSPIALFKTDWEGVFHLFINLNTSLVEKKLMQYKKSALLGDSGYLKKHKDFFESEDNKEAVQYLFEKCYLANGMLFLKDHKTYSAVSSVLKINAEENWIDIDKKLPKTPLFMRDIDFDLIVDEENIAKYFSTSHRAQIEYSVNKTLGAISFPDFYGKDVNGAFMNYMFKANNSPHALIFGGTGAGKSVAALKIFMQITGFDPASGATEFLSENRKVRYINVGFTGGRIFQKISEVSPSKIEIFPSKVAKLRFSLFEFSDDKDIPKDEMDFILAFINLMLDVSTVDKNNPEILTNLEESSLESCIREMFAQRKWADLSIEEIAMLGGYEKIVQKAEEAGATKKTKASTLGADFSAIQKPCLIDLIRFVEQKGNASHLTATEKQVFSTLAQKLNIIDKIGIFSHFSNVEFKTNKFIYYVDFDEIKDNKKIFISLGWLLIRSWYNADKKIALNRLNEGKPRPDSFYFVEEAHNFLSIPMFEKMLMVFAREARKYGIHLIPITQSVQDIPTVMYEQFNTKMFIYRQSDQEAVKRNIESKSGVMPREQDEVFRSIGDRMLFIMHDNGVSGCELPKIEKDYPDMFTPYDIGRDI